MNLIERQTTIAKYVKGCFQLPSVKGKESLHVIPMSGGADSFVVAHVLTALFPDVPFVYVNADTGIEKPGTEEALDKFEQITGKKIIRLIPKFNLFESIERAGNYLPSARVRSCTSMMKSTPIKAFYKMLRAKYGDVQIYNHVGLRADEPQRTGIEFTEENMASVFPLQQLGMVKSDVNNVLHAIQGIPSYYVDFSRSGCICCIFSRRSEMVAAWQVSPSQLTRAALMEELPSQVVKVLSAMPQAFSRLTGRARNWVNFFRPSALAKQYAPMPYEDVRGKMTKAPGQVDMFGLDEAKRLFVAVEYSVYGNGGILSTFGMNDSMVYGEKSITYSTTLSGLKTALKFWWLHRLQTKELYSLDEEEMREERRVFIMELQINNFESEIPETPKGVFTWQSDRKSLFSIRKTSAVIEHILLCEGLYQESRSNNSETRRQALEALSHIRATTDYGNVLSSYEYDKPYLVDLIQDADIEDAPVACLACSR